MGKWNCKIGGELFKYSDSDAWQNVVFRRRKESSIRVIDQKIGRRSFGHVTATVEKQGPCAWLRFTGLLISQVVVHPATAFQLRRPALNGNLHHVSHHK